MSFSQQLRKCNDAAAAIAQLTARLSVRLVLAGASALRTCKREDHEFKTIVISKEFRATLSCTGPHEVKKQAVCTLPSGFREERDVAESVGHEPSLSVNRIRD